MSIRALALAVRNHLRTNLTNFYLDVASPHAPRTALINHNCRVMPNERPVPSCGEEFIAVYGTSHRPRDPHLMTAVDEQFGITIAISRKVSLVPGDSRGELGYIWDNDAFEDFTWKTIEERAREIIGLLDKNYVLMQAANALLFCPASPTNGVQNGFSEPLYWVGSDSMPQEVGAEHFCAYHTGVDQGTTKLPGMPEADDVYGFLMKVRFDGAIRFQPTGEFDTVAL